MILNKQCKIELAASSDKFNPNVSEPYLDIPADRTKAELVATDGTILCHIPVPVEDQETAGHLSGECLKTARRNTKNKDVMAFNLVGDRCGIEPGMQLPRNGQAEGEYPRWREVVPDPSGYQQVVALDAERLWRLAQAMGTTGVVLWMNKNEEMKVLVRPCCAGPRGEKAPADRLAKGVIATLKTNV